MAITSQLQRYSGLPQVIKKTITNVSTVTGVFKQPLSLMNPTFEIQGASNIANLVNGNVNYMTIEGKKYFIMDVKLINNHLAELRLHIDALTTYQTQLNSLTVILERSSNSPNQNIRDNSHPVSSNKTYNKVLFPKNLDETEEGGTYILVTAQKGYSV